MHPLPALVHSLLPGKILQFEHEFPITACSCGGNRQHSTRSNPQNNNGKRATAMKALAIALMGILKNVIIFLFAFYSTSIFASFPEEVPPSATITVDMGAQDWVPQPGRVLTSGQVMRINGTGTYYGSITVRSGAHVVVCGSTSMFGSVNVNSGGHYWRTPTTGFTGSLTMDGTLHVGESSCDDSPCTPCADVTAAAVEQFCQIMTARPPRSVLELQDTVNSIADTLLANTNICGTGCDIAEQLNALIAPEPH